MTQLTLRKLLSAALLLAALTALGSAGVELVKNRRWDGIWLTMAAMFLTGAAWVYARADA